MKISFVGAGSMAEAIFSGLIDKGICRGSDIFATNRNDQVKMADLERKYGIRTTYNMEELLKDADIIVLAIKPSDAGSAFAKNPAFYKKQCANHFCYGWDLHWFYRGKNKGRVRGS